MQMSLSETARMPKYANLCPYGERLPRENASIRAYNSGKVQRKNRSFVAETGYWRLDKRPPFVALIITAEPLLASPLAPHI